MKPKPKRCTMPFCKGHLAKWPCPNTIRAGDARRLHWWYEALGGAKAFRDLSGDAGAQGDAA